MQPDRPETGYGYIERGEAAAPTRRACYRVARFIEKPDAATAASCWPSGRHLWNSGMFVFTAAHAACRNGTARAGGAEPVRRPWRRPHADLDFIRLGAAAFDALPRSASTMRWPNAPSGRRGAGRYRLVRCRLLGALRDIGAKDAARQRAVGDVLLERSDNCYARSDGIADRLDRPAGPRGGGHRGRGAGDAPRRAQDVKNGGPAEGGRAARGGDA